MFYLVQTGARCILIRHPISIYFPVPPVRARNTPFTRYSITPHLHTRLRRSPGDPFDLSPQDVVFFDNPCFDASELVQAPWGRTTGVDSRLATPSWMRSRRRNGFGVQLQLILEAFGLVLWNWLVSVSY